MTEGMRYVMDALKNSQHNTWDEAAVHEIIHFLEKADTTVGTEEVIRRIYHLSSAWESQTDERLTYKEYVMPEDADESLDMLIRLYMDKSSRRVKYACAKLRKAFPMLPPVEQRRVGLAFLHGSRTDTEWICQRLADHQLSSFNLTIVRWHPSYADAVEQAWNKYRGKYCGRLLIQFLDKEIVRSHLAELQEYDNLYFALCRRFVNEPWFMLDKARLARCTSINAYLSVMSRTRDGISDPEAEELLYQWVGTIASLYKGKYSAYHPEDVFWDFNKERHSVIAAWGLDTALYYMLRMKKNHVVAGFLRWAQTVQSYYSKILPGEDSPDNKGLFINVILEYFPEEYGQFCHLDVDYYTYAYKSAQPFTLPRIDPRWKEFAAGSPFFPPYPLHPAVPF